MNPLAELLEGAVAGTRRGLRVVADNALTVLTFGALVALGIFLSRRGNS